MILRGARQVGKTFLLKDFGAKEFRQCHYFNFEEDDRLAPIFERDLKPGRLVTELRFLLGHSIDPAVDLVIFDEIQRCPRALTSLKYFCEDMPELAVCAAGSLLGVSLTSDSFPVGKVTFMDLMPMTFEEFLQGVGSQQLVDALETTDLVSPIADMAHEQLWEMWKCYLVVGGLPEAVNCFRQNQSNLFEAMQSVRKIQRDLLQSYQSDIAKHSGKTNALNIERLWRNVPEQLARIQDGTAPKFKFRDAIPGLRGYDRLVGPLDWLERANLLIRTSIVETVAVPLSSQRVENCFKLYLFDVGLLGAMSNLLPATIFHYGFGSYQGYVAENFVAQELRAAGCDPQYAWAGRTAEVEFLLETAMGVLPLEVKSGRVTQSKSLGVYEKRYQPGRSYVLSANNMSQRNVRHRVPLYAVGRLMRNVRETSPTF